MRYALFVFVACAGCRTPKPAEPCSEFARLNSHWEANELVREYLLDPVIIEAIKEARGNGR